MATADSRLHVITYYSNEDEAFIAQGIEVDVMAVSWESREGAVAEFHKNLSRSAQKTVERHGTAQGLLANPADEHLGLFAGAVPRGEPQPLSVEHLPYTETQVLDR